MFRIIYGVGVNDAGYVTYKCPYYQRWKSMLARCYSERELSRYPNYKGCYVCNDWLVFSKFKEWMREQDWVGKQLDKDILVKGNKEYSPDKCVFVTSQTNSFMTERTRDRGPYMIGVSWNPDHDKFIASLSTGGKVLNLGYFENELDAHKSWLRKKKELAKDVALWQTDQRVADAIIKRYDVEVYEECLR